MTSRNPHGVPGVSFDVHRRKHLFGRGIVFPCPPSREIRFTLWAERLSSASPFSCFFRWVNADRIIISIHFGKGRSFFIVRRADCRHTVVWLSFSNYKRLQRAAGLGGFATCRSLSPPPDFHLPPGNRQLAVHLSNNVPWDLAMYLELHTNPTRPRA